MKSSYAIIETGIGWMGVLGSPTGLRQIVLPQSSSRKVISIFGEKLHDAEADIPLFGDLPDRLIKYFNGEIVTFPDMIDIAGATPFQFKVWQVTRSIPYGETMSYGWIARQIGIPGGARAAGQALTRNPLPVIIPCHRVISATGGGIGGFSYGQKIKHHMLQMEASGTGKL